MYFIFGLIDPRTMRVFHVGCARDLKEQINSLPAPVAQRVSEMAPDIPQAVILQQVESHPLATWVKWCKRLRRDLVTNDWQLHRSIVDTFTNSVRLRRALGQEVPSDAVLQEDFHKSDRQFPKIFEEILRLSREKKADGYKEYSIHGIVSELRCEGPDSKHPNGFKIPNGYCAFYARKVQMVDHSLCGFFVVNESMADDLVLDNGTSWREFAKDHADAIRYSASSDEEEDTEWTY